MSVAETSSLPSNALRESSFTFPCVTKESIEDGSENKASFLSFVHEKNGWVSESGTCESKPEEYDAYEGGMTDDRNVAPSIYIQFSDEALSLEKEAKDTIYESLRGDSAALWEEQNREHEDVFNLPYTLTRFEERLSRYSQDSAKESTHVMQALLGAAYESDAQDPHMIPATFESSEKEMEHLFELQPFEAHVEDDTYFTQLNSSTNDTFSHTQEEKPQDAEVFFRSEPGSTDMSSDFGKTPLGLDSAASVPFSSASTQSFSESVQTFSLRAHDIHTLFHHISGHMKVVKNLGPDDTLPALKVVLEPRDLGTIEIHMRFQGESVFLMFKGEGTTLNLLQSHAELLSSALQEQGLSTSSQNMSFGDHEKGASTTQENELDGIRVPPHKTHAKGDLAQFQNLQVSTDSAESVDILLNNGFFLSQRHGDLNLCL